jgi:Na+-translocating ferredoxin:NAD+ oxidoreductase RnfD subunit
MTVGRFLKTPKGMVLIVLSILAALAMVSAGVRLTSIALASASLAAMVADLAILRMRKGKWLFPSGALITGMLVAMVLSPREPWWVVALTALIAILSKYLVRGRTANVFNPAALALFVAYYLFESPQSWWGALPEMHPAALLVLIGTGAYVVVELNKIPSVLTFLGAYFLLFTITALFQDSIELASIYRTPNLHAALFFALFMVTDPPTAPPGHRDQMIYAVITAVAAFVAFVLVGGVHFLMIGLLVANIWEGLRRARMKHKPAPRHPDRHPFGPALAPTREPS